MSKSTDNGAATATAKNAAKSANANGNTPKSVDIAPVKTPTLTMEEILDNQIKDLKKKYELIKVRNKFLETKSQLKSYVAEQGSDFDQSLEHNNLRIVLQDDRHYSNNPISISNNGLVRDFCEFLINRVDQKLINIESQLLG